MYLVDFSEVYTMIFEGIVFFGLVEERLSRQKDLSVLKVIKTFFSSLKPFFSSSKTFFLHL